MAVSVFLFSTTWKWEQDFLNVGIWKGYLFSVKGKTVPCEQLVSPTPNKRETTGSNRLSLWVNRRPAPGTNKLTLNRSNLFKTLFRLTRMCSTAPLLCLSELPCSDQSTSPLRQSGLQCRKMFRDSSRLYMLYIAGIFPLVLWARFCF